MAKSRAVASRFGDKFDRRGAECEVGRMGRRADQDRVRAGARRLGLALLVLVAVLLRGITPAGWMPNPHGAIGAPLIICTAEGIEHVQLDPQGHPAKPQSTKYRDACPFAGHVSAPPPTPATAADRVVFVNFT